MKKIFLLECLFAVCLSLQGQLKVQGLRVEFLKNPIGIDASQPRLSWRLDSKEKEVLQRAYEIRVGKDAAALSRNDKLVWQTGKIASEESLHLIYGGEPLQSAQQYYWQVRVWDNKGHTSPWSDMGSWQMGLLAPEDWKARWIGLDVEYTSPADDHRRLPARLVRRGFRISKPVTGATVFLSGLGYSELYLNGVKVDHRIMDPATSNYDRRVLYTTFDVTKFLHPGNNALGVILGNGRFFSPRIRLPVTTPSFGFPKMLLQMQVRYADGTSELIISDENWRITDQGPIRANSEFDGEEYDATMEQEGWDKAGFDDSRWLPVQMVSAPKGRLIAQMQEPMRVVEELSPVSLYQPRPGVYLADFGQNLYGMCRIKVQGPKGTKILLRTAFDLDSTGNLNMAPNRSALSADSYTLKGKGVETWSPRFRGQGTRYAEITGWPGVPKKEDLTLLAVQSDLEGTGAFTCSNDLVNKIYANTLRSVRMQERGVPVDPDRDERQAWLSVSEKTSETEGYMFNVAAFYHNFLEETRYSQRPDGLISEAGSLWLWETKDPCWPAVITSTPWSCYYMYGDRQVLAENYPTMRRWALFLEKNNDSDYIYRKGSYSDWVDAYSMDKKTSDNGGTPRELLSTAYLYFDYKTVERTAAFLGRSEDAAYFNSAAKKVEAAFLRTFFDAGKHTFLSGTQTSYVLPLAFDLVPAQDRQPVIDNLVHDIMITNNGHLTVGCPGLKWLMQVLTSVGHTDAAYTILTQTTRPSWGYMVSKGGTSIWERWDRDTRDPGMNGQSQTILAGYLGAWMYQTLGGIAYDSSRPGFKNIIMRPQPAGDLKWVNASFKSLYGQIISNWKVDKGQFHWKVTIPANTTATLYFPKGVDQDPAVHEIGSGTYEWTASFDQKK